MASPCSASPVLDPGDDDGRLPVSTKMTDNLEAPDRVERIEQRLEGLAVSVDRRFDEVDKRFDEVDKRFDGVNKGFADVSEAIAEQRRYTEFAFERLDRRLTSMDAKIDDILGLLRR
jgi:hypothetical protein